MHNVRMLWLIIKKCHFEKFFIGFLISFFIGAAIIRACEPGISTYGEAMWYTFVACTTIGFGDFAAVTPTGRILTVYLTVYEILLVALLSGVIVSHYLEVIHRYEQITATVFLDKMQHLTELDKDELKEMEKKAKEIAERGSIYDR
jgi:voltage-gated potassium channel